MSAIVTYHITIFLFCATPHTENTRHLPMSIIIIHYLRCRVKFLGVKNGPTIWWGAPDGVFPVNVHLGLARSVILLCVTVTRDWDIDVL